MVERLKTAIEKARRDRDILRAPAGTQVPPPARPSPPEASPDVAAEDLWRAIPEIELDEERLTRERVVTRSKSDPSAAAFDLLRTRILKVCETEGWSRIGATSPTQGCSKTSSASISASASRAIRMRGRF